MFGGGPHSGLCKQLKAVSVHSVLEVGVGDGSQAIAVMETLSRQSDSIRYYAIDEFETGWWREPEAISSDIAEPQHSSTAVPGLG